MPERWVLRHLGGEHHAGGGAAFPAVGFRQQFENFKHLWPGHTHIRRLDVVALFPGSVDFADQQGFFWGLIHGFIAPLTFIISLFMDDVTMYGINNSGSWYDFGFLLGIGGFSGGIFKSSKRRK